MIWDVATYPLGRHPEPAEGSKPIRRSSLHRRGLDSSASSPKAWLFTRNDAGLYVGALYNYLRHPERNEVQPKDLILSKAAAGYMNLSQRIFLAKK